MTATEGTLTVNYLGPNTTLGVLATPENWLFTITPEHASTTGYSVYMVFPTSDFLLVDKDPCTVSGVTYSSCAVAKDTNSVKIKLAAAYSANTAMSFYVSNVRNPISFETTAEVAVYLVDASNNNLDKGTGTFDGSILTNSNISTFTVTPASYVTGAQGVTYTFTVVP